MFVGELLKKGRFGVLVIFAALSMGAGGEVPLVSAVKAGNVDVVRRCWRSGLMPTPPKSTGRRRCITRRISKTMRRRSC